MLYEKKEGSINIYKVVPKSEEIKRYRKSVLERTKECLVYKLKNGGDNPLIIGNKSTYFMHDFVYDNSNALESGSWSSIYESSNDFITKSNYLAGIYDTKEVAEVYQYNPTLNVVHRFLQTMKPEVIARNSYGLVYMSTLLDLPENLYNLHMLLQEKYDRVVNSNIQRQLQLFDYELMKNISFKELEELKELGLIQEGVDSKSIIGSMILKKIKKDQ